MEAHSNQMKYINQYMYCKNVCMFAMGSRNVGPRDNREIFPV